MTAPTTAHASSRGPRWFWVLVAAAGTGVLAILLTTSITLLVGAALKAHCLTDWTQGRQPRGCYNDIQTLWFKRDLALHVAPYQGTVNTVHEGGQLMAVKLGPGEIEYPVLTGVFAWVTALPASTHAQYLAVSVLALAPLALVASYALHRVAGRRALLFAASPQLAAYAFLNWDLLPVAATAGALWAWYARRSATAAMLLALGTWAKIWPGFLLVPLLVHLVLEGRRRDTARVVVAAAVTSIAVNLPFVLVNARGWAAPYLAQSVRLNSRNTNAIWYWLAPEDAFRTVNTGAALAVAACWAALGVAGYLIARREGTFPWLQVGAAMVTTYIAVGRVDSPQYGLWLLPFLVVLQVRARWVALFMVSDIWLWLQWSWLWAVRDTFQGSAVAVRVLVLLCLAVVFVRARPWFAPEPAGLLEPGPAPDVDTRLRPPVRPLPQGSRPRRSQGSPRASEPSGSLRQSGPPPLGLGRRRA